MAIVNQATNQANGNPNPQLYALATQAPNAFHDITVGNNSVPCIAGSPGCSDGTLAGYAATPGYDLATGWGSVDAYVFVHAWAGNAATPPPPTDSSGGGTGSPPPPVPGGSSSSSATASTYHVFPQFADGRTREGVYRTTIMISNTSSASANCTVQLRGLTVTGFPLSYHLPPNGWTIASTDGTQDFRSGYASLKCDAKVEAQLLYSYYSTNGTKLSEATVFSSPPSGSVLVIADQREGAQLGVAIANDSDQSVTYTITAGNAVGPGLTLNPRTSVSGFIKDLVPNAPANDVGLVQISAKTGTASVVGLRFTGSVFTTIPENMPPSVSTTANMHHVFPQFVDGKLPGGSYYRTTRIYINTSSTATAGCDTRVPGFSIPSETLPPASFLVSTSNGTQTDVQVGYVTLQCSSPVDAQELYSYYGADGKKLSEATVFSSPAAKTVQILADSREGAQIGLAIANDSDQANSFSIAVTDVNGTALGTVSQTLDPHSSIARFLTDFVTLPNSYVGRVTVSSDNGTVSIIGLRYTGNVFTTIPEAIVQ
jgi:hypothetical protein